MPAQIMNLSAFLIPRVHILRMPLKLMSVPKTGSTVELRSRIMRFAWLLCMRWCILPYSDLYMLSSIFLYVDLPMHCFLNGQFLQTLDELR
jgi:hypothetical protein